MVTLYQRITWSLCTSFLHTPFVPASYIVPLYQLPTWSLCTSCLHDHFVPAWISQYLSLHNDQCGKQTSQTGDHPLLNNIARSHRMSRVHVSQWCIVGRSVSMEQAAIGTMTALSSCLCASPSTMSCADTPTQPHLYIMIYFILYIDRETERKTERGRERQRETERDTEWQRDRDGSLQVHCMGSLMVMTLAIPRMEEVWVQALL